LHTGNPTGTVLSKEQFKKLIALSDQYGFVIASDECYSELWFDEAPIGLLEVCAEIGRDDYKNCIVFHSFLNVQTSRVCVLVLLRVMQHY
jgi:N-succinyldiaminopimelate aminotransferase